MDEVRLYNRTLTSGEVKKLYNWAPGPVAHWRLDEGAGTTAFDSSGNGNTATLNNDPTWTQGRFGASLRLDGTDNHLTIPSSESLSIAGSLSINTWIKPSLVTAETDFHLIGKLTNYDESYLLSLYGDELRLYLDSADNYVQTTGASLTTDVWYFISAVYNASEQTAKIYVNGIEQTTTTTGTIPDSLPTGSSNVYLGGLFENITMQQGADEGQDTHIREDSADTNFGSSSSIIVGRTGSSTMRKGLLKFDISQLPPAASVDNSTLTLVCISQFDSNKPANLHQSLVEWFEHGSTWNHRNTDGSITWTGGTGGDAGTEYLSTPTATGLGNDCSSTTTYYADVTSDVADWYDGSATNHGWWLVSSTTSSNSRRSFSSSDTKLSIDYRLRDLYAGIIDDVQIYNYPLTPKQITNIMNARPVWAAAVGSPVGSAVIHYKLDEGYGATANNHGGGGSALNGTITGASWTTEGKVGKALSFDGSGDYIQRDDTSAIDFSDGFTFSGWFYPETGIANKALIVKDTAYRLVTDASGNPQCQIYTDSWQTAATSSTALTVDNWHHVLCAYDQADGNIKLYINGQETASQAQTNTINNSTANLRIGSDTSTTYGDYQGRADEIKLYNFGLSASEVLLDYNQGKASVWGAVSTEADGTPSFSASRAYCIPGDTATCNSPVGEWLFDDGSGTVANDTSGNGNDGTLEKGPQWVPGRFGNALEFDRVDDSVDIGNNVKPSLPITISGWVKIDSFSGHVTVLRNDYVENSYRGAWLGVNGGNQKVQVNYGDGGTPGSSSRRSKAGDSVLDTNTWYFIVGVIRGPTDMDVYINGVDDGGSYSGSGGAMAYGNDTGVIGVNHTSSGAPPQYTHGMIDQVRIYDYARTPAQVAWEYNKGAPVGHWKMDECSGTLINDWAPGPERNSFMGNNGTLVLGEDGQTSAGDCQTEGNTAWWNGKDGKFGASLNFDGEDDYVTVPDDSRLRLRDQASFSFWYRTDSYPNNHSAILQKGNQSDNNDSYTLSVRDDGSVVFAISNNGTFTPGGANSSPTAWIETDNQWHHYVVVWIPDTTNGIRFYKDGVLSHQTDSNVLNIGSPNDGTLHIGLYPFFSGYLPGALDDLRIYNYPLTPHQIRDIMNLGAVRFE